MRFAKQARAEGEWQRQSSGSRRIALHSDNSVDPDEVARFSALSDEWWDPNGSFAPLHRMNPARLEFIRDQGCSHFGKQTNDLSPLKGLDVLDIGCGGGLISEPLCRMGAKVTGVDASEQNISVARHHAEVVGLDIDYRASLAEDLLDQQESFDLVVALEIVEHVPDPNAFVAECCRLTRPGGAIVFATINRTPQSFLKAIVGAEYILRWLPRGTHRWDRFVRPSELGRALSDNRATIKELMGLEYDFVADAWRFGSDVSVNYMLMAGKAG